MNTLTNRIKRAATPIELQRAISDLLRAAGIEDAAWELEQKSELFMDEETWAEVHMVCDKCDAPAATPILCDKHTHTDCSDLDFDAVITGLAGNEITESDVLLKAVAFHGSPEGDGKYSELLRAVAEFGAKHGVDILEILARGSNDES